MYCCTKINNDIIWIGVNDRKTERFENYIPLDNGVTYNSYLILDEKICIIDGVEEGENGNFLGKIEAMIGTAPVDYIIVNHVEPDHSGSIKNMLKIYPEIKVVGNAKTIMMLKLLGVDLPDERIVVVKEKDVLDLGKHKLTFYLMPMVHWPESMATYDITDKILFSNDAFGSFGALDGAIFNDEANLNIFENEMRRYYSNIVGKYGPQTLALLKKAANLDIDYICPLHGPIWREKEGISWIIDKYSHWAGYIPESDDVVIFYGSIYGGTEDASDHLAAELAKRGAKNIKMYDVSTIDPSYMLAEAFRAKKLVFAASTYNLDIFPKMEILIDDLIAHGLQNRIVALMENGSWAVTANKKMKELISNMKNMTILEETVSIKSALKAEQMPEIEKLAQAIVDAN